MTTIFQNAPRQSSLAKEWRRWVLWFLSFAICFAWTYLFGLHVGWNSADHLRALLQGTDMAHGNVLLNHWYSGTDSYWAVDSVLYALGVLAIGSKVVLAHIIGAFVWSTVIVISCVIANTGLSRRSSIMSSLAIVITLGLPTALFARFLTSSADHVATTVVALLAFMGLRTGRFNKGWLAAVLLLSAGLLSDPLLVAYALVPAFAVGILDSVRSRLWSSGLATCSAPIASIGLAVAARKVAELIGTYQLRPGTQIVSPAGRIENLHALIPDTLALLGVGSAFSANRIPWELGVVRIFSAVLLGAGLLVGFACLLLGVLSGQTRIDVQVMAQRSRTSFRLNDLLVFGVVGDVVTYVALRFDGTGLRYLTPGLVFAAILGAMLLGHLVAEINGPKIRKIGALITIVVLGVNIACASILLSRPMPRSPYPQLTAFLVRHHLHRGVGDYWTSSTVTLYSEGTVTVRQVLPSLQGGIGPYLWIDKGTWFEGKFQFLVLDARQFESLLIRTAPKFPFAKVSHFYRVGPFRIVEWQSPHTLRDLSRG